MSAPIPPVNPAIDEERRVRTLINAVIARVNGMQAGTFVTAGNVGTTTVSTSLVLSTSVVLVQKASATGSADGFVDSVAAGSFVFRHPTITATATYAYHALA